MANKRRFRLNFKSKLKDSVERIPTSEIVLANDLSHALAIGIKKAKEFNRILRRVEQIE